MLPTEFQKQLLVLASSFPAIKKILLFGSRAYGDHDDRSDVDLAIVAPNFTPSDWAIFSDKMEEELDTLLKIDLVNWSWASDQLKSEIKQRHLVIYTNEDLNQVESAL